MIYYKVVRQNNKSSMVIGKYSLSYKIGAKTLPKIGKIYAFDNIVNALMFCAIGEKILVGEGRKSKIIPRIMHWDKTNLFKAFWSNPQDRKWLSVRYHCPFIRGTILLDWFKPTAEL